MTTRDEDDRPDWLRTIEREHATIRTLVRALQTRLAAERPAPEWTRAVEDTVSALIPVLQGHFSREERELAPSRLPASSAEIAERMARLNAEHGAVVAAFTRARQACIERGGHLELPNELRLELSSALEALERHEELETELLADHWSSLDGRD